jgi:acyl transferase domain-containing protein
MMMQERIANTNRVPSSRFNIDAYHHQNLDRPGSFNVPGGYFLDDHPEDFDPTFFKLSPVEAMRMDPQQRNLLEVVYEAFENSGSTLKQVSSQVTGCFVASFSSDYQQMTLKEPDLDMHTQQPGLILAFWGAESATSSISKVQGTYLLPV